MKKIMIGIALSGMVASVPVVDAAPVRTDFINVQVPAYSYEMQIYKSVQILPGKKDKRDRDREAGRVGREIGQRTYDEVRSRVPNKVRDAYDEAERIIRGMENANREGRRRGDEDAKKIPRAVFGR